MDGGLDFQIQQDYINHQITSDDSTPEQHSGNTVNPLVKCPTCHEGFLNDKYTPCGYVWCILCFPCGIICCMETKKRLCSRCRAEFPA